MSPLVEAMRQIAEDIEAAVPPDRTDRPYHEIRDPSDRRGASRERGFVFGLPQQADVTAERGDAMTEIEWDLDVIVLVPMVGRARYELADAIATEGALLRRTIDKRSNWPAGVVAVIADGVRSELDESGDAILTIETRITTEEVD